MSNMKFLLPILLFIAIDVYGQCKYEKNEIDKFEKTSIKITEEGKIAHPIVKGFAVWLSLAKIDSIFEIRLRVSGNGGSFCLNDNSELLFLLESGEVVRLNHLYGFECTDVIYSSAAVVGSFWFKISRSDLELLKDKKLDTFRLYTTDGTIEIPISKNNASKDKGIGYFIKYVPCILN